MIHGKFESRFVVEVEDVDVVVDVVVLVDDVVVDVVVVVVVIVEVVDSRFQSSRSQFRA